MKKTSWRWFEAALLTFLIVLGGFGVWSKLYAQREVTTVEASIATVRESVKVTGRAKAAEEVSLSFPLSGEVMRVLVNEGDSVVAGEALMQLNDASLRSTLAEAIARKEGAEATYADLRIGPREEDIAVAQAKLSSAHQAYADTKNLLLVKAAEAYTAADSAIFGTTDTYFTNPQSGTPTLRFSIAESVLRARLESARVDVGNVLLVWSHALTADDVDDEVRLSTTNDALKLVREHMALMARAINTLPSSTTNDTYKTQVATQRTALDVAFAALETAGKQFEAARADVSVMETQLTLAQVHTREEKLAAQRAAIAQTVAQMERVQSDIDDTTLRTPIGGVITEQLAEVGEVVPAYQTLVSIKSLSRLEVEAFVPEINIGKVLVGNRAELVFDAFPDRLVEGTVTHIDESETILDGVTNYKVVVSMDGDVSHLRSGMTADVVLVTREQANATVVPQYVISEDEEGRSYVEKVVFGEIRPVYVTLGLLGDRGYTEILSGVVPGDALRVPFVAVE